jgi:predicted DCC family thiol-disulfide oxidoreductase YuxK
MKHQPIILFDGNCMLCNHFVQFALKRDKQRHVFVSSHSSKGKELCLHYNLPPSNEINTVYLIKNNNVFSKSKAVLKIMSVCGPLFKITSILLHLIPGFIRDYLYGIVSRNRHKLNQSKCVLIDEVNSHRVFL